MLLLSLYFTIIFFLQRQKCMKQEKRDLYNEIIESKTYMEVKMINLNYNFLSR